MTWHKPTKPSFLQTLAAIFRRARTSLYEPFADPRPSDPLTSIPGPRMAKVLPFRTPPQPPEPTQEPAPESLPPLSSHRSMPPPQSLHIFLPRSTNFAVYD